MADAFSIDARQVKQFENELKGFKIRALPFATKATLNRGVFETQQVARQNVREDMITRNAFSVQSIQFDKAKTLNIRNQQATVGSIADYMEVQEFGGTKSDPTIATGFSAGQEGTQPRTRLPFPANKIRKIKLQHSAKKGKGRKQRNLIAVKQAAKTGKKFVYLDMGRTKGIFKVIGGKRNPKVKMVHDLSEDSVAIPRNPWLLPAVQTIRPRMNQFYGEALRFQLKKHNLFKG